MINQLNQVMLLLQQMCVYLVIAYLLSKTPFFPPLMQVRRFLPHKLIYYFVFSSFCLMGNYFSLNVSDSIANTRAVGAVLGGLLGGPIVGLLVGLTGGLHRYTLGGMTALPCAMATIFAGSLGGIIQSIAVHRHYTRLLFNPLFVAVVALIAELVEMMLLLIMVHPFDKALQLVQSLFLPMLITNTLGAAMFMRILLDHRIMFEKYTHAFSSKALNIAARTEGVLRQGLNQESSMKVAKVLYQELGVGAVAMTDREKLLAFIGIGVEHNLPNTPITSHHFLSAIRDNRVIYVDGTEEPYQGLSNPSCKLGSSLVIPLCKDNQEVIGTIKLYEPKNKLFSTINRTLGEGIASLLSAKIVAGQYERNKQLLAQSEIKLLHAQVNPHFLFNALNTLVAVINRDNTRARELVQSLSTFFRKNLKRSSDEVSLEDEIEHVNAYLQIEKARFADRLEVSFNIPVELLKVRLPAFSLQPIVENAIKHGTSQLLGIGRIEISALSDNEQWYLSVKDNAGLFQPKLEEEGSLGLGLSLVDKRIRGRYGDQFKIDIRSELDIFTCITLRLPLQNKVVPESAGIC